MKKFKISNTDGTPEIRELRWFFFWMLITDGEFESYVECEDYLRENYKNYEVKYEWY